MVKENYRMMYLSLHTFLQKERKVVTNKINKILKDPNKDSQNNKDLIILLSFRSDWLRIQSENIYNKNLK